MKGASATKKFADGNCRNGEGMALEVDDAGEGVGFQARAAH